MKVQLQADKVPANVKGMFGSTFGKLDGSQRILGSDGGQTQGLNGKQTVVGTYSARAHTIDTAPEGLLNRVGKVECFVIFRSSDIKQVLAVEPSPWQEVRWWAGREDRGGALHVHVAPPPVLAPLTYGKYVQAVLNTNAQREPTI